MQSCFSIKGEGSNNNSNKLKGNHIKRTEEEKKKHGETMKELIRLKKTDPNKLKEERIEKAAEILFEREMKINKTNFEINKTNNLEETAEVQETIGILNRRLVGLTRVTTKRIGNEENPEIKARAEELLNQTNDSVTKLQTSARSYLARQKFKAACTIAEEIEKRKVKLKIANYLEGMSLEQKKALGKERSEETEKKYKRLAKRAISGKDTKLLINTEKPHNAMDRLGAQLIKTGNANVLHEMANARKERINEQVEKLKKEKAKQREREDDIFKNCIPNLAAGNYGLLVQTSKTSTEPRTFTETKKERQKEKERRQEISKVLRKYT
jgi:hypothetical protein